MTSTGVLPSARAVSMTELVVVSLVECPRMTSTSCMTGTGFIKCIPMTWAGRVVCAAISVMEMELVFVARTVPAAQTRSSCSKMENFTAGFSLAASITSSVMDTARALGKTPVEVNDYPGFVSNRVLMPMINEAIFCVMEGVATAESIDTVMKLGMAHPMGPLTLADFIGLDVCLAILEVLHHGLGDDKYRPCPLLRKMVAAGYLGRKSGRGFYDYEKERKP